MKSILFLLLVSVTLSVKGAALPDTILRIGEMPPNGFQLMKWRYQMRDDPAYASVDFDDKGWKSIVPAAALHDLPADIKTGMGWLRLKFKMSPELLHNNVLYFSTPSAGAELYFNGRLLKRSGAIDPGKKRGRVMLNADPVSLPVTDTGIQVLAVRFAGDPFVRHLNNYTIFLSSAHIAGLKQIVYRGKRAERSFAAGFLSIGVLLLLTVFHFILFYSHRTDRANLYFAGFTFCSAIAYFLGYIDMPVTLRQAVLISFSVSTFRNLLYYFEIKALNSLFGFRAQRLAEWTLLVLTGITVIFTFGDIPSIWIGLTTAAVPMLIFLIIIKALIDGKPGAAIIAPGFLVSLVSYGLYIYLDNYGNPYGADVILTMFFTAAIALGSSLSISIFLSRDAGKKSLTLQNVLAHQNEMLEQQVEARTVALRVSQNQLIQAEKMASLGELTAGIAHEIQNPLNFVNNFAEVSLEMIEEVNEEFDKGAADDARIIVGEIHQNLEKIFHHGKRADEIVKSMLEHSRASTGQREPTDINKLADEYLKLAYHGLRAKDKTFNAELQTDFDADLPLLPLVPQDIGRVLLNLFNNAFYAVREKQRTVTDSYQPQVGVKTSCDGQRVMITVSDNGTGIPEAIREKIMQPFFTTKPTGQGTGLGLSLSYDIVVKTHGGKLFVAPGVEAGAKVIVVLPLN